MSILGSHYVNQAAPIAGIISAGVLGGFAGPGAPFLRAESVFAPSQPAFPVGETPSSGFDALLTAAEGLESAGPVPRQLNSSFSSTATSEPESSSLMQSICGLSASDVPGCVNFVNRTQTISTIVFSVDAVVADDKMGRSLIFFFDDEGHTVRARRHLDCVRTEFNVCSLSQATSLFHNTMSQSLCPGLEYQDPREPSKLPARKAAFNALLGEASQNQGQLLKTGQSAWYGASGFLAGGPTVYSKSARTGCKVRGLGDAELHRPHVLARAGETRGCHELVCAVSVCAVHVQGYLAHKNSYERGKRAGGGFLRKRRIIALDGERASAYGSFLLIWGGVAREQLSVVL